MRIEVKSIDELPIVAERIIEFCENRRIVLFTGDLGAGKTTLIKSICEKMLVEEQASSPTYSIVNEYETVKKEAVFHLDLYRLKDLNEAMDIGVEEILYSGNYCFIEWPDVIDQLLPENIVRLTIEEQEGLRIINLYK